jgi:hypothetical protein
MNVMTLAAAVFALLWAEAPEVRPCDGFESCVETSAVIADTIAGASEATGVDPVRLATIAYLESGFNPERHGVLGRGVFGLNPHGRTYRDARALCAALPVEACFDIQAVMAARYLAEEHRRCGSWESAVRSYGSGTCDETPGSEKYLSRYLRAKRAVRRAVREAGE